MTRFRVGIKLHPNLLYLANILTRRFNLCHHLAQVLHIFASVKNKRYEKFIRKSPTNGCNQKINWI